MQLGPRKRVNVACHLSPSAAGCFHTVLGAIPVPTRPTSTSGCHISIPSPTVSSNAGIDLQGHDYSFAGPASLEEARRPVSRLGDHFNTCRLHSALGKITSVDALAGRAGASWTARGPELEWARVHRRAATSTPSTDRHTRLATVY